MDLRLRLGPFGLPRIIPSIATTVSAPTTQFPGKRPATLRGLLKGEAFDEMRGRFALRLRLRYKRRLDAELPSRARREARAASDCPRRGLCSLSSCYHYPAYRADERAEVQLQRKEKAESQHQQVYLAHGPP